MISRRTRLVLETLENRITPATTVNLWDSSHIWHASDVIVDDLRQLVYIPTTNGDVLRYDLQSQQLLSPWHVGQSLSKGDLSADGQYLVVGEAHSILGRGVVYQVQLSTGQITSLSYFLNSNFDADGVNDVVMLSATRGLVTSGGTDWRYSTPLYEIDLAASTVVVSAQHPYVREGSSLARSADYQTAYLLEKDKLTRMSASGPESSQDAPIFLDTPFHVNAHGTMAGFVKNGAGIPIFDAQYHALATLSLGEGKPWSSIYFDPVRPRVYFDTERELIAYNTTTWKQELAIQHAYVTPAANYIAMTANGQYYFRTADTQLIIQDIPVAPGPLYRFEVNVVPQLAAAGTPRTVTVTAIDLYGQVKTDYTGTVHFSVNDGEAQLPADTSFSPADAGKKQFTAVFNQLGAPLNLRVHDTITPHYPSGDNQIGVHSGQASNLTALDYSDSVFDPVRNRLYLSDNRGMLQRFDLTTQSMLEPWKVGNQLGGMDVSPDGQFLYVTERLFNVTQGAVYQVDLSTGVINTLWYKLGSPVLWYGWRDTDVAMLSDGTGAIVGTGGYIYRLDTAQHITLWDRFSWQNGFISATPSYDRQNVLLQGYGYLYIYHQATGAETSVGGFIPLSRVTNQTGNRIPVKDFTEGFSLIDIATPGTPLVNHLEAGLPGAFDPNHNWFYVSQPENGWLVAYDLATDEAVSGSSLAGRYTVSNSNHPSRISNDGRWYVNPDDNFVQLVDLQQSITAQLSVEDTQIVEGTGGTTTLQVHVRLSEPVSSEVTVHYETLGNTAAIGLDFLAASGDLHFAPGELEKTVAVTVVGDNIYEETQRFSLALSKPVNAFVGAHYRGWVTINEDESPPVVQFQDSASFVLESAYHHYIPLTLSWPSELPIIVQAERVGGTASDDDVSLFFNPSYIPVNNGYGSLELYLRDDVDFEPDETVIFRLVGAENAFLGDQVLHTCTIVNDDPVSVQWELDQLYLPESITRPAIRISLAQAMPVPVSVGVLISRGDEQNQVQENDPYHTRDYRLLTHRVIFAPGQTMALLPLQIINDSTYEYDEALTLMLTDPRGGIGLGSRNSLRYVIQDDDRAPQVSFSRSNAFVREAQGVFYPAYLQLSAPAERYLSVAVSSQSQAASAGSDFFFTDYYNFAPGQTKLPFEFYLNDNEIYQPTRLVQFQISSYLTEPRLGAQRTLSLFIQDNDPRPTARFSSKTLMLHRADELVPIVVQLDRAASISTRVAVMRTGGSALDGIDYRWDNPPVQTVEPGQTEVTFWLRLLPTANNAAERSLSLRLVSLSPSLVVSQISLSVLIHNGN